MFAEIQNISVYYHKSLAIKDVTVNVPEAGVVSIIGANGAGKSTILKVPGRTRAHTGAATSSSRARAWPAWRPRTE